jgi:antitoxin component YwqK of YwqJK toxin-antitoxin module
VAINPVGFISLDGKIEYRIREILELRCCRYPNGSKESEGPVKDGLKEGLWRYYSRNGELDLEMRYKNGILNGLSTIFGRYRRKTGEGHYQDGRKVGVWRYWSDVDGEIIRREQYYFSD